MVPKAALVISVFGSPKLEWFRILKNSDRNCSDMPSRAGMTNRLFTPTSHCQKPGARSELRPRLPYGALAEGIEKAVLLK